MKALQHCPRCNSDYCAPVSMQARVRRTEDAAGFNVLVSNTVYVSHETVFAGRRDDYSISFLCEYCGTTFTINYVSHKGQTEVNIEC